MKTHLGIFKFTLIFFLLITLASCGECTYPKVKESVKNLCKDEYDLDVDVKIIGSTLGVYIPIEGLVDPDLKLNEKAGEKIENVALSIHRVTMSSEEPIELYVLTARDKEIPGAEFTLTGFIYDIIRVRLFDISRGEYHKRILRDFRFNPIVVGEQKVKDILESLNKNTPYAQAIKTIFYPIFTIGLPGTQKIETLSIEAKEISESEALLYVKTKEFYVPLPNFEAYRAIFPPGFNNEYLLLVNVSSTQNPIKEIVSKYFLYNNEIRQRDLKVTFDGYQDLGYVGIDGLPKKALRADWFLSQQIARRIKMLSAEDKDLKDKLEVKSSYGSIENMTFRFKFLIEGKGGLEKDDEIIFFKILKLAGQILHRYDFGDFDGLELVDIGLRGKSLYLSKEDLEKFRQGKIKIEDITFLHARSGV